MTQIRAAQEHVWLMPRTVTFVTVRMDLLTKNVPIQLHVMTIRAWMEAHVISREYLLSAVVRLGFMVRNARTWVFAIQKSTYAGLGTVQFRIGEYTRYWFWLVASSNNHSIQCACQDGSTGYECPLPSSSSILSHSTVFLLVFMFFWFYYTFINKYIS